MRMTKLLLAGAALLTTAPVLAAPAAQPAATSPTANAPTSTTQTATASGNVTVGATVRDPKGGTVGKIESVEGQYAVLATTKNKVRLPLSSFGKGADGPVIALTEAQVDAAASAAGSKTGAP
jgi:hypothetical protein